MSKRAEELARAMNAARNRRIVDGVGNGTRACGVYDPQYDVALIDAALLRERELAAERMASAYNGRGTIRNFKAMKAAILSEEEP